QTGQNVLVDTLSDGSVITLNKRSTITYPSKFKGNTRAIALKGEAFFNVAPDQKKPFIISVNDEQETVVGTSFNIKSENGNTADSLALETVHALKYGNATDCDRNQK